MTDDEYAKLNPRVQKNLLDAHHQAILHTYDATIREALKLAVAKAIEDGRPQLDVAVVVIDKNDGVVAGLPEDRKAGITFDYNVIWGYRQDLAKMSPWGNPEHLYYDLMQEMAVETDPKVEPGEVSVFAAVFAFDVATVRRLHFTPKKFVLKPEGAR
jgi:hypothetical protein